MANWNGLQLTNKGIALQAKVQAGEQLVITKLKLGSGVVPSGTDIKTLTDLIAPEQNLGIGAKEAVGDYCKVSSTISNVGLSAGYYVRELGVFAQDPDDGEILYLYTTDGAPDYLPAGSGSTVISQEFSVMIAVDDADNVKVEIDAAALATMGYVQLQIAEHNADTNAHTSKIATQSEAETGTNNVKFMTPLRTKQAINKLAPVKSVNGVVADSAGNVNLNFKFYSKFEQLGLSADSNNVTDICNAMPNYSLFICYIGTSQQETVGVPINGVLKIDKGYGQAAVSLTRGHSTGSNSKYINYWESNIGTRNWTQLCTLTDGAVPIANGGTGATTAANARSNLGITAALGLVPVGTVLAFAGSTVPSGFLNCNGATVSRTTYSALYSAIGTTYGSGDGSTTFSLPNYIDKFLQGNNTAGTNKSAGLPNIEGYFAIRKTTNSTIQYYGGALRKSEDITAENASYLATSNAAANAAERLDLNASNSNSIYGASTTVQPPAVTVKFIIKY